MSGILKILSNMSDHAPVCNNNLSLVSANLQSPYAIKIRGPGAKGPILYAFDLPNPNDWRDNVVLRQLTGMSVPDCAALVEANSQGNEQKITQILNSYGTGEPLGEGGVRRSIETEANYLMRMNHQVDLLIQTVEGGAKILCFQEQPYQGIDPGRSQQFEQIMNSKGYIRAASRDLRDVGIWVHQDLESQVQPISDANLPGLAALRGCAAVVAGILCITLHVNRDSNKNIINNLILLRKGAEDYANNQNPPLKISITGDMNLFQLNKEPDQKQRLENAGYTTQVAKGQEKFNATATCEASFTEDGGGRHDFNAAWTTAAPVAAAVAARAIPVAAAAARTAPLAAVGSAASAAPRSSNSWFSWKKPSNTPPMTNEALLMTLIDHFARNSNANNPQTNIDNFTFGESKTSHCHYVANNDYQILVDKNSLVVLLRTPDPGTGKFPTVDDPARKEAIVGGMLTRMKNADENPRIAAEVSKVIKKGAASSDASGSCSIS